MSLLRRSMRGDHASHCSHVSDSCQLGETKPEMLQEFESECQKALWHVFHVLDSHKTGSVQVSQLKVITSNVGLNLGVQKAEELLNKEDTPSSMQYDAYFDIVKTDVINKQDTNHEEDLGKILSDRLIHVIKSCWMFCNFERNHKSISFTNEHCSMLWRLFNVLSETDDTGSVMTPVVLHPEEAILLFRDFIETTGQLKKEQLVKKFSEEETGDKLLTFEDLLNVFERDFASDLSRNAISLGLNHLYDTYVLNILKKGMLWKRGYNVKSWKERWFVLVPAQMKYYASFKKKELKGSIDFDMDCKLEVPVDRPTHKPNRFVIVTKKKPYDMSATDVKTKNEWVSAVEAALDRVGKSQNVQKEAARERCRARREKKRLLEEEEKRRQGEARLLIERQNQLDEEKQKRLNDEELLRARLGELEEERRRREDAEARFHEEQALREMEQERLRELERIKQELESLLAEERQAKKDEEIVRNLQSRLLEEEFQRREELEQLQHQQQEMLSAEREHRESLESERRDQERLLEQARERLQQLEREQAAAASKMQEASAKLERAEKHRRIMEDKAKLWRTPVGLARPIQPRAKPLLTHRGQGAFCDKDFELKAVHHQTRRSLEMDSNLTGTADIGNSETTMVADISGTKTDESELEKDAMTDENGSKKITVKKVNSEDGVVTSSEAPVKVETESLRQSEIEEENRVVVDVNETNETSKQVDVEGSMQADLVESLQTQIGTSNQTEPKSPMQAEVESSTQTSMEPLMYTGPALTKQAEVKASEQEEIQASNQVENEALQQADIDGVKLNSTESFELRVQLTGARNEENCENAATALAIEHDILAEKPNGVGDDDEINSLNESEETNKPDTEHDSQINGECLCVKPPAGNDDQVDQVENNTEATEEMRDNQDMTVIEAETKSGDNADMQDEQGAPKAYTENGEGDKEEKTRIIRNDCSLDKDGNGNVCVKIDIPI